MDPRDPTGRSDAPKPERYGHWTERNELAHGPGGALGIMGRVTLAVILVACIAAIICAAAWSSERVNRAYEQERRV